jgi:nucleotide-binding universal stress UspA family protein
MRKILVPCDFSKPSLHAFQFAMDVASRSKGAVVHLLNVIELPVIHDSLLMPVLSFEKAFMDEAKEDVLKRFDKLKVKYAENNVKVVGAVEFGSPVNIIRDFVHEKFIDLIIMGSHGASGVKELFIGTTAEKVVRTSPVPVLVIKDQMKNTIKHIVFPNNLDEDQVDLVMRVKALQNFFKARLHVLWINTPLNFTSDTVTRQKLTDFAEQFDLKNCTLSIFNHDDYEAGILAYAHMVRGNLIAMGTQGRTGLNHFFNGSKAEDVVNHVAVPVWTCLTK